MAITKIITPDLIDLKNSQLASGVATTYVVTVVAVAGVGNRYFVNGVQAPNIVLIPGTQYIINQDDASNAVGGSAPHPIVLSTTIGTGGAYSTGVVFSLDGTTVSETVYRTNASFVAATQRRITITLSSPPTTLYYICWYHQNMGNTVITVGGALNTDGIVLAKGLTTTTVDTIGTCSYPSTAVALFQLDNNIVDTCSNYTAAWSGTAAYSSSIKKFGTYSAQFPGLASSSPYINTGVNPDASSNWTVSVWVYRNTTTYSDWVFGSFGSSALFTSGFGIILYPIGTYGGAVDFYIRNSSAGTVARFIGGSVQDNQWVHLAATHNNSGSGSTTVYQNGTKIAPYDPSWVESNNPMTGTQTSGAEWCLASGGEYDAAANEGLNGYIDQARFFNTELNATEIEQLYNETNINAAGRPTTNLSDGEFRYNTTTKKVEFYDGTAWFALTSSASVPQAGTTGGCNYPTTATALYQLNSDGGVTNNVPDTCGTYDGTATSITYSTGNFGNAAIFNGSSSGIVLPSSLNTNVINATGAFSISMWINTNSLSAIQYLFCANTSSNIDLSINGNNQGVGKIIWTIWKDGIYSYLISTTTITTSAWYHIVATYNNGSRELFINSASQGTSTKTLVESSTEPTLGYRTGSGSSERFDGEMDQLRIFPSALTQEQVSALYTETTP